MEDKAFLLFWMSLDLSLKDTVKLVIILLLWKNKIMAQSTFYEARVYLHFWLQTNESIVAKAAWPRAEKARMRRQELAESISIHKQEANTKAGSMRDYCPSPLLSLC